jgi:phage-related protein
MIAKPTGSFHHFNFNGVDSLEYDLYILSKGTYNAPERDVTFQSIPGKSGDLIIDNGRYKNLSIPYKVALLPAGRASIAERSRKIKRWLLGSVGYYRLADSYDERYFRLAAHTTALDIEEVLPQYGEMELVFNCKPQRYSFEGQRSRTITAAATLINPEIFPSNPYIKITGSGSISLHINNDTYSFTDVDEYIELDSELKNAYKGTVSQNSKMTAAEFPTLAAGENLIQWTGTVSTIEIAPRWWTI